MSFDFSVIVYALPYLLQGAKLTLAMSLLAILLGIPEHAAEAEVHLGLLPGGTTSRSVARGVGGATRRRNRPLM